MTGDLKGGEWGAGGQGEVAHLNVVNGDSSSQTDHGVDGKQKPFLLSKTSAELYCTLQKRCICGCMHNLR